MHIAGTPGREVCEREERGRRHLRLDGMDESFGIRVPFRNLAANRDSQRAQRRRTNLWRGITHGSRTLIKRSTVVLSLASTFPERWILEAEIEFSTTSRQQNRCPTRHFVPRRVAIVYCYARRKVGGKGERRSEARGALGTRR